MKSFPGCAAGGANKTATVFHMVGVTLEELFTGKRVELPIHRYG